MKKGLKQGCCIYPHTIHSLSWTCTVWMEEVSDDGYSFKWNGWPDTSCPRLWGYEIHNSQTYGLC